MNIKLLRFFAELSIYLQEHPESYEEVRLAIKKLDDAQMEEE